MPRFAASNEIAQRDSVATLRAERDAARSALRRAYADRELFVANLSHELRTPLTAILGYADLLRLVQPAAPNAKSAYYLDAITAAGGHLADVLDTMLNLARLRAGAVALEDGPVEILGLIEAAAQVVAPMAAADQITILIRTSDTLPAVRADGQLLRQILINLLSNAIKASPPHSSVTITATLRKSGQMQIVVRDHGPGMDASTIERVMRPFAQAVQATGFASPGTGLGLSLVRTMAELHDGNFQLVSHVGHGTRAVLTLPAARVCRPVMPGQQAEFTFVRSGTQPTQALPQTH